MLSSCILNLLLFLLLLASRGSCFLPELDRGGKKTEKHKQNHNHPLMDKIVTVTIPTKQLRSKGRWKRVRALMPFSDERYSTRRIRTERKSLHRHQIRGTQRSSLGSKRNRIWRRAMEGAAGKARNKKRD